MSTSRTSPLRAFIRASTLHIGAAAAAASLRHDLVKDHQIDARDIDAAYAVSRITPGTNLLALYALLGHRLGGWRLAIQAVAVGALLPAVCAVAIATLYVQASDPVVSGLMSGARAGGVAVFLGAAVRLLKPQIGAFPWTGAAFTAMAFGIAWTLPGNIFAMLLAAGVAGAICLRPAS